MNKKLIIFGLFLLVSSVFVNAQTESGTENCPVVEKAQSIDLITAQENFKAAREELFYQRLVEIYQDKQINKENIDALLQKLEIKDPKRILIARKNQLERKSMVFYTIKLLGCGAAAFYGVVGIGLSIGLGVSGKVCEFARMCNPGEDISDEGCYFMYVSTGIVSVLLAKYGVRGWKKSFADERVRLQQIFIVDEIIKELDRTQNV